MDNPVSVQISSVMPTSTSICWEIPYYNYHTHVAEFKRLHNIAINKRIPELQCLIINIVKKLIKTKKALYVNPYRVNKLNYDLKHTQNELSDLLQCARKRDIAIELLYKRVQESERRFNEQVFEHLCQIQLGRRQQKIPKRRNISSLYSM